MTETDHMWIREISRHQLEYMTLAAMREASRARLERESGVATTALVLGFGAGAILSAAAFMIGAMIRLLS